MSSRPRSPEDRDHLIVADEIERAVAAERARWEVALSYYDDWGVRWCAVCDTGDGHEVGCAAAALTTEDRNPGATASNFGTMRDPYHGEDPTQ